MTMLFKPELIQKIVRGEKIQTRRPMKTGEVLRQIESPHGGYKPLGIYQNNRAKMLIGNDYAVVPGRGKPTAYWRMYKPGELPTVHEVIPYDQYKSFEDKHGKIGVGRYLQNRGYKPLRILITDIRREDVRRISLEDVEAEGFYTRDEFWNVWCSFYDVPGLAIIAAHKPHNVIVRTGLLERPDELYQAWAYTFEVLR
jgi:hypothetical protein